MTAACPFCARITAGEYIDRSYDVVWFEPLNPVVQGHMLFVPLLHIEHGDLSGPIKAGRAMQAAAEWGAYRGEEFNLITSYGAAATQTVPHIHAHYVPRREGDGFTLPWTGQKKDVGVKVGDMVRTIPELHALPAGTVVREERSGWVSTLAAECVEHGRIARMTGLEDERVLLGHRLPVRVIDGPHVIERGGRR